MSELLLFDFEGIAPADEGGAVPATPLVEVCASAVFSQCRTYRYQLSRSWDASLPTCTFIGMNPSTADETADDPTIRKCIKYAKREGCGTLLMVNAFAYRGTDPACLVGPADPVGPENDHYIIAAAESARGGRLIAAWGTIDRKSLRPRAGELLSILKAFPLLCLRESAKGYPWHPLYVPDNEPLKPYPQNQIGGEVA